MVDLDYYTLNILISLIRLFIKVSLSHSPAEILIRYIISAIVL